MHTNLTKVGTVHSKVLDEDLDLYLVANQEVPCTCDFNKGYICWLEGEK